MEKPIKDWGKRVVLELPTMSVTMEKHCHRCWDGTVDENGMERGLMDCKEYTHSIIWKCPICHASHSFPKGNNCPEGFDENKYKLWVLGSHLNWLKKDLGL